MDYGQSFKEEKMHKERFPVVLAVILVIVLTTGLIFTACSSTPATTTPAGQTQPAPAAKQVLIRMTTPVPVGDDLANMCQAAMDKFNAKTNGAYKMQMFPGEQLAKMPESLDAIRTGAVEGGVIPLAAFAGTVPEFALAELPFLYNNGEANSMAEIGLKDIDAKLLEAKANQTTLGCIYVGSMNFLSTKPIKTLEDLKGLVIGCDTPPAADLVKALGGSGIVVNFTEDYSNLQKAVINAKTSAPQYIKIAKLYEVAKYYTVFYGLGTLYSININLDIYNKMPQNIKEMLNTDMSKLAQDICQYNLTLANNLVPELTKAGLQYYNLPAAERDRWKALAYPGTLAALAKFGDVGAQVKQVADAANAKYPYIQ
jgi:TRAP-type C4-dicarboxylate transport system substrate-binding protein